MPYATTLDEVLALRSEIADLRKANALLHGLVSNRDAEIERLRALIEDACKVFDHYDLPEHAFHYRRAVKQKAGGK